MAAARSLCLPRLLASIRALLVFTALYPSPGLADDPVPGEIIASKPGEFARLVVKLQSEVGAEVRIGGNILVIQFSKPVDVGVDKLAESLPDYIGSGRVDPDGLAIRLALSRKVTPNVMAAGERLFVDLLPEGWAGAPPGLPPDVVKQLADRARAAEQALRQQRRVAETQKQPPVRVKALKQPTFVRYVFDLSSGLSVSSILSGGKLTLNFSPTTRFDLADAQLAASTNVVAVSQKLDASGTTVTFDLVGEVDVHAFRDDKAYLVDVGFEPDTKDRALLTDSKEVADAKPANAPAEIAKPQPPPSAAPDTPKSKPSAAEMPVAEREPPMARTAAKPEDAPPPVQAPPSIAASPASAAALVQIPPEDGKPALTAPAVMAADGPPAAELADGWPRGDGGDIAVQVKRSAGALRLLVPFAKPASGAAFSRGDSVWLAFAGEGPFDLTRIVTDSAGLIRSASLVDMVGGRAIRLQLTKPQSLTVSAEGAVWAVDLSDGANTSPQALTAMRNIPEAERASVSVPIKAPGQVLKLTDPEAGDSFMVVTAALPAQGFVRRQNFVDFSLLMTAHGIVIQPNADDLQVGIGVDRVTLGRPGGLRLSTAEAAPEQTTAPVGTLFDLETQKANRAANFIDRRDQLTNAAAMSSGDQRIPTHVELARFYMAYGLYPEAKGALDVPLAEAKPTSDDALPLVLRGVASILAGKPERGLADLANPIVGAKYDAQLWRGVAYARQGKWADARETFKGVDAAIGSLPPDLQREVILDELRAASELHDYAMVSALLNDLESVGASSDLLPSLALIRGRMDEALGKDRDALDEYRIAVQSADRRSAAAATVDEIALRQKRHEISNDEALAALETLSMTWRGDATEVRTMQLLARLYVTAGRYRDALLAARTATRLQANSAISRRLQDDAATLFTEIFLASKGDDLPPVQALGLFYEFSELTPIGRRGDELIRRLAERLVAIDLLDQAGELLQYQIDNRLDGAARAQVASRLAMIYLMNRKPERAIAALRTSRVSDLAGELRMQRLMIEARAQSDIGRPDLALDIVSNLSGREVLRLRADIQWAARRWRESSEQIELMYGTRWQDFQPLTSDEKGDIIRAAIGYSLAADQIGTARLREKYAAKMENDDKAAFDAATNLSEGGAKLGAIARMAASVDTLGGFIRDMKARFPEAVARAPLPDDRAKADPFSTGSLPKIEGLRPAADVKLN